MRVVRRDTENRMIGVRGVLVGAVLALSACGIALAGGPSVNTPPQFPFPTTAAATFYKAVVKHENARGWRVGCASVSYSYLCSFTNPQLISSDGFPTHEGEIVLKQTLTSAACDGAANPTACMHSVATSCNYLADISTPTATGDYATKEISVNICKTGWVKALWSA